jgi:hypothetical protein
LQAVFVAVEMCRDDAQEPGSVELRPQLRLELPQVHEAAFVPRCRKVAVTIDERWHGDRTEHGPPAIGRALAGEREMQAKVERRMSAGIRGSLRKPRAGGMRLAEVTTPVSSAAMTAAFTACTSPKSSAFRMSSRASGGCPRRPLSVGCPTARDAGWPSGRRGSTGSERLAITEARKSRRYQPGT